MDPEQVGGYPKGRERRAIVLESAARVFGSGGFHGATLSAIASASGISKAGLVHHFPTKEALLMAVLEHRDRLDTARFGLDRTRGIATLGRLVRLVGANASRRHVVELYVVLAGEATSRDHPANAFFVQRSRRVVQWLTSTFEEAQGDGHLASGVDPGDAASGLVAVMDGAQIQWLLDPAGTDMARLVSDHIQGRLAVPLPTS